MSECNKYEFRQPVEVLLDGEWRKAVYDAHDPTSKFCHLVRWYAPGDTKSRTRYMFDSIVRPDPDFALVPTATPRTGWRLPEPGDVVRIDLEESAIHGQEVEVVEFRGSFCPLVIKTLAGQRVAFELDQVELVRLHDAPQPKPAPEPLGTLDACLDRVRLLNAGLDLAISVLNADAPPPALRDAAVLAIQAVRVKLGGES